MTQLKVLLNKILVVVILFLFILVCNTQSYAINTKNIYQISESEGIYLFVGGSGPNNYTKIQDAIDDASDGDTVYVFDDSSPYYEHLIINNSIDLIGENRDTTTIDGGGTGIIIDFIADYVNVSGFTIAGGGKMSALFINSENNNINCNHFISNNWIAIYLIGESNKVTNNTIDDNYHTGVYVVSSSRNNFIYNNTIQNCGQCGISLTSSCDNIVSENIVINCELENIMVGCGKNHLIINNTLAVGQHPGINLVGTDYTIITGNDISGFSHGILLNGANNNIVTKNFIHKNYNWGIRLFTADLNIISHNEFVDNDEGISLGWSDNNTIFENLIMFSGEIGICMFGSNNVIYHNNIWENRINAIGSSEFVNIWDNGYPTGGNYWSDYDGEDNDNDGIGDTPYQIRKSNCEDRYPLMDPYGEIPLMIRFIKPEYNFLYIFNVKLKYLYPMFPTIIIGKITVKMRVTNYPVVEKVELYRNGNLVKTFFDEPYNWLWHGISFSEQTLKAVVYDKTGNKASIEIKVWKFL